MIETCRACHNLLTLHELVPPNRRIKCNLCGEENSVEDILLRKTTVREVLAHSTAGYQQLQYSRQTVSEKCPKCGNDEMYFATAQLRSADEGQTVFFDCPKCGYKFSQNS